MLTLAEQIKRDEEKLEQKKRRRRAQIQKEKEKSEAVNTRRKIIAGAILLDIFPQFQTLTPQRTNAETYKEFAPLAEFLKSIKEAEK